MGLRLGFGLGLRWVCISGIRVTVSGRLELGFGLGKALGLGPGLGVAG